MNNHLEQEVIEVVNKKINLVEIIKSYNKSLNNNDLAGIFKYIDTNFTDDQIYNYFVSVLSSGIENKKIDVCGVTIRRVSDFLIGKSTMLQIISTVEVSTLKVELYKAIKYIKKEYYNGYILEKGISKDSNLILIIKSILKNKKDAIEYVKYYDSNISTVGAINFFLAFMDENCLVEEVYEYFDTLILNALESTIKNGQSFTFENICIYIFGDKGANLTYGIYYIKFNTFHIIKQKFLKIKQSTYKKSIINKENENFENKINELLNEMINQKMTFKKVVNEYSKRYPHEQGLCKFISNYFEKNLNEIDAISYFTKIINKFIDENKQDINDIKVYNIHNVAEYVFIYVKFLDVLRSFDGLLKISFFKSYYNIKNMISQQPSSYKISLITKKKFKGEVDNNEIKDTIFAFIKNREPLIIISKKFKDIGEKGYFSYLERYIFSSLTEVEIVGYICDVVRKLANNKLIYRQIKESLILEYVFGRNEIGYNQNSIFNSALKKANNKIQKDFLSVPQILLEDIINRMNNRDYINDLILKYKNIYYFRTLNYIQDIVILNYGESEFLKYVEDISSLCINEMQDKNVKINDVNLFNFIFGVKLHLKNASQEENKVFLKLYYKAVFHKIYKGFTRYEHRRKKYDLLELTEDEIINYEKYYGKIENLSIKEVLIKVNNIISEEYIARRKKIYKTDVISKLMNYKEVSFYCARKHNSDYFQEIDELINKKANECKEIYIKGNIEEINSNKINLKLFYLEGNCFHCKIINFSKLLNETLVNELKQYLKDNYIQENTLTIGNEVNKLIGIFYILNRDFAVNKISDVDSNMIYLLLHKLQQEYKNTLKTASMKISLLSKVFEYYLGVENYVDKPMNNPCLNVKIYNADRSCINTSYIPDHIIKQIYKHIDKIEIKYALMFRLFMYTGCRFKEISYLDIESIKENAENEASVEFVPYKIIAARRKRQLPDCEIRNIPLKLFEDLQEYILETRCEREKYIVNQIFFNYNYGKINNVSSKTYNKKINDIIKEYNIKDYNGELWKFTSKQVRKTLGTNLISSGSSLGEVQRALGHLSHETTEKYYAEVKLRRINELNTEFYKGKFKLLIGEENLSLYTEEERKWLYVDFRIKEREVEFGVCLKHAKEGNCKNVNGVSCATCPKLCTGKKFLDKWEHLFADTEKRINELKRIYEKNNINSDEYAKFAEYIREEKRYNKFKDILYNINKMEY